MSSSLAVQLRPACLAASPQWPGSRPGNARASRAATYSRRQSVQVARGGCLMRAFRSAHSAVVHRRRCSRPSAGKGCKTRLNRPSAAAPNNNGTGPAAPQNVSPALDAEPRQDSNIAFLLKLLGLSFAGAPSPLCSPSAHAPADINFRAPPCRRRWHQVRFIASGRAFRRQPRAGAGDHRSGPRFVQRVVAFQVAQHVTRGRVKRAGLGRRGSRLHSLLDSQLAQRAQRLCHLARIRLLLGPRQQQLQPVGVVAVEVIPGCMQ